MHDLFDMMTAVDSPLADMVLHHSIDFLIAQTDENRMKPITLREYFAFILALMCFCADLLLTPDEFELVRPVDEVGMKHITFANDMYSFEMEVLAAKDGFELGATFSSVPMMRIHAA
ncbi:hypothetical protein BCR34DRAFT_608228 [Clohesyomyces aquaticus]|uniref:Uncharacterized protein n=1 Tax=Clohesyomyces aquaticus TaxID=1231657 RepID=A0A1Y1Y9W5_9PLEO|nr:hypothetical protein BCR34DRAFT_608228 [Clohesyomyces aquaticus]